MAAQPRPDESDLHSHPSAPPQDKLAEQVGAVTLGEDAPLMPRGRRWPRAAAVQALYESDVAGHPGRVAVERLAEVDAAPGDAVRFALELVAFVERERAALDGQIGELATEFPAGQLAAVDRNVLRMALAEMKIRPERPAGVVVNEAVEIARLFGSDSSAAFVNGVLGTLLR
jgi:N utilization substance protein B